MREPTAAQALSRANSTPSTGNSRSQRVVDEDLAELVAPLSGPSYGAYAIAKRPHAVH